MCQNLTMRAVGSLKRGLASSLGIRAELGCNSVQSGLGCSLAAGRLGSAAAQQPPALRAEGARAVITQGPTWGAAMAAQLPPWPSACLAPTHLRPMSPVGSMDVKSL